MRCIGTIFAGGRFAQAIRRACLRLPDRCYNPQVDILWGEHVLPRTYVALDLETTGLSAERDAILEVGAVKYQDGEPVESFESLINPGRPIPYEITLITGIRNEDVIGKPAFERVAPALRQFVGPAPIVGQNIAFDLGFLRRTGLFVENRALDTWELASVLAPGLPSYSLGSLALHFGIASPNGHRALNDASVTAQLFEVLRERAAMLPSAVLAEILRLAAMLAQWGSQWDPVEVFEEAAQSRGKQETGAGRGRRRTRAIRPAAGVPAAGASDAVERALPGVASGRAGAAALWRGRARARGGRGGAVGHAGAGRRVQRAVPRL